MNRTKASKWLLSFGKNKENMTSIKLSGIERYKKQKIGLWKRTRSSEKSDGEKVPFK